MKKTVRISESYFGASVHVRFNLVGGAARCHVIMVYGSSVGAAAQHRSGQCDSLTNDIVFGSLSPDIKLLPSANRRAEDMGTPH